MILISGAAVLALSLLAAPSPAPADDDRSRPSGPCCFTNPAYSGACLVTPGPEETCDSVLTYLNDAKSSGKSYCNSSELRGNWKQMECPPPPKKK